MRLSLWPIICLILALLTACGGRDGSGQQPSSPDRPGADWLLENGRFYTADDHKPWAEAIAISDGEIIYVGDAAGAHSLTSGTTRRTDLNGRMVLPGMIDGHTHPGYIDLEQYGTALPEDGRSALLDAVAEYAEEHPGDDWIRLCCWPNHLYIDGKEGPHRQELDAVVADRPVWIASSSWHSYWLNTKALEILGVNDDTQDPRPGIATYVRDEKGALTGWVKEGAGWQHLASQFPTDRESHEAGIAAFLQTLSEHGVTTVYDGGNFGYEEEVYGYLAELDKSGKLPLRYEGTFQIFAPNRRHIAVAEMRLLREKFGGERLRFNTIKLFMDGINENRSGAMLDPLGDNLEYAGTTMLTEEEFRDFLLELHREKMDLHVHTIGDLAVQTTLDAVEAAQAAVEDDFYPRVTLSHLEVIDPADLARFRELGVSANFTPWWHGVNENDAAEPALGEDRFRRTYTAKPLFDSGALVTFSSDDWNLPVLSPFLGMQVGHTRRYPQEWGEDPSYASLAARPPETEQLGLELMVRGYTINGAYAFRMENRIGSIEVGKLADLVVLDQDLFTMDPYEIHKIKPSAVIMEGELIHGGL